jgi:hypothetical protein
MRKEGQEGENNKWGIFVVICNTDIQKTVNQVMMATAKLSN